MKQSYSSALYAKKPLFSELMLNGHFSKKVAKDHNLNEKWPFSIITLKKFPKINFLLGPHRKSSQNLCSTSFYLRPGVCMPRGVKLDPW
jgi:hypothetical protein